MFARRLSDDQFAVLQARLDRVESSVNRCERALVLIARTIQKRKQVPVAHPAEHGRDMAEATGSIPVGDTTGVPY